MDLSGEPAIKAVEDSDAGLLLDFQGFCKGERQMPELTPDGLV